MGSGPRSDTLTAPGSKTWDYDYNANGQVITMDLPNGMTTYYTYDNRARLSKIQHKDGASVEESYDYDLDNAGNITKATDNSAYYWDYTYDGRHRLSTATLTDGTARRWAEEYTYDDADNLVTKESALHYRFDDASLDGWDDVSQFTVSDGRLKSGTSDGHALNDNIQTEDHEIWLSYYIETDGDASPFVILPLYDAFYSPYDHLKLKIYADKMILEDIIDDQPDELDRDEDAYSDVGTWYDLYIVCDDNNVTVYRTESGGAYSLIFDETTRVTSSDQIGFWGYADDSVWVDNLIVLSGGDGMPETFVYTYNDANELITMSRSPGGTDIVFTYDSWGRMSTQTQGTDYTHTYDYAYGSKLQKVTMGYKTGGGGWDYDYYTEITYKTGGDGKRRARTSQMNGEDAVETWYNWNMGWNVVSEEDDDAGAGALTNTYIGKLADVVGDDPANDDYHYYLHDNLGSTRLVYDQSKTLLDTFDYSPYGTAIRGTGHDWDQGANLYYAPYRHYNPATARWTMRDPLGMIDGPNVYAYVMGNPVCFTDPTGELAGLIIGGSLLAIRVYFVAMAAAYTAACVKCTTEIGKTKARAASILTPSELGKWSKAQAKGSRGCIETCAKAGIHAMAAAAMIVKTVMKYAKLVPI